MYNTEYTIVLCRKYVKLVYKLPKYTTYVYTVGQPYAPEGRYFNLFDPGKLQEYEMFGYTRTYVFLTC